MNYEFLLFDADNTLFDFSQGEHNAFSQVMKDFGLPEGEGDYACYSAINDSLWKEYEKGLIEKKDIFARRFVIFSEKTGHQFDTKAFNDHYVTCLGGQAVLLPYAEQLLRHLKEKGYRLFLITNGSASVQEPRLAKSTVKGYFEKIFISELVGHAKPSLLFFEKVADAIPGFDKSRALVIGDSESADILGANRFGVDACYFSHQNKPLSQGAYAKYTIKSLEELDTIL